VNWRGKTIQRGVKLWLIGTDTAKHLLHGRMRLTQVGPRLRARAGGLQGTDEFEQMTAAKLMPVVVQGKHSMRWITPHGKREEAGDCMVYAYARRVLPGDPELPRAGLGPARAALRPARAGPVRPKPEPAVPAPTKHNETRGREAHEKQEKRYGAGLVASRTPQLDALIQAEPDLVDRIFDYVVAMVPASRAARGDQAASIRAEFAGQRGTWPSDPPPTGSALAPGAGAVQRQERHGGGA
jgi:hypothetical protein